MANPYAQGTRQPTSGTCGPGVCQRDLHRQVLEVISELAHTDGPAAPLLVRAGLLADAASKRSSAYREALESFCEDVRQWATLAEDDPFPPFGDLIERANSVDPSREAS